MRGKRASLPVFRTLAAGTFLLLDTCCLAGTLQTTTRGSMDGAPLPQEAVARLGSQAFIHSDRLESIVFSPDGTKLFAVASDEASLWDLKTRKKSQVYKSGTSHARGALSHDGRVVLLGDRTTRIRIFDAATGRQRALLENENGKYQTVALSPDGRHIARGAGNEVILWDVKHSKELRRWRRDQPVHALQFSPDGKSLAIGSSKDDDSEISIQGLAAGELPIRLEGGTGFRPWLRFSPDGKSLAGSCEGPTSGGHRSSLRFWNTKTGKVLRDVGGSFDDGAFSSDGKWIAVSGSDVIVYDTATGTEIHRLRAGRERVWTVALSPDSKTLAAGYDRQIRFWDTSSWSEINPSMGHLEPVLAVAFAPDARTIATGGLDGVVVQWSWPGAVELNRTSVLPTLGVQRVTFSPDSRTIAASAWYNQGFMLLDADTGTPLSGFGSTTHKGLGPVFLKGGNEVLAGRFDGATCVWGVPSGTLKWCNGRRKGAILSLQPSPDERTAWWAGEYQGLGLRNLITGEDMRVLTGGVHHPDADLSVAPDRNWLTAGGKVWDVATGEVIATVGTGVAAISPDGRLLASGGDIWEVLTRKTIHHFEIPSGSGRALAFSPDGTVLAMSAYNDVLLWDMTGRLRDGRIPELSLTSLEMERLWQALGGDDAWGAHQAAWTFAATGKTGLAFLAMRVKPAGAPDSIQVGALRKRLSDPDYEVREYAARELLDMGVPLRPEHIQALRRPEPLVSAAYTPAMARKLPPTRFLPPPVLLPLPERVRISRAVMAIEHSRERMAATLLEKIADGTPSNPLTKEAKAALERIKQRR